MFLFLLTKDMSRSLFLQGFIEVLFVICALANDSLPRKKCKNKSKKVLDLNIYFFIVNIRACGIFSAGTK